jgi:pilus assembly protein CpaC
MPVVAAAPVAAEVPGPLAAATPAASSTLLTQPPAPASGVRPAGAGTGKLIANFPGALEVSAGQSILLRLASPAERVAIADPEVAEVVLVSPEEVLINGKGRKVTKTTINNLTGYSASEDVIHEAQTSVIVWDRQGRSDLRTLYVNRARVDQVLLEVTVADVNRTAVEQYGFDFQVLQDKVLVSGTPSKIFNFNKLEPTLGAGATGVAEELNITPERLSYLVWSLDENFLAFIELMQRESLAKILARPVLLARSGEEAHIRVGGEVPVVYATQNVATITFKEFGVLMTFTPNITDDGEIDLRVSTEVSQPSDAFRSVSVGGTEVPSFISRQADTRVRLRDGQTLLIGGLYREDETENEDKVPYLGDIPYLGYFFRRTRFDRSRSELLILVKPNIARDPSKLVAGSLPSDRPPLSRSEVRTQPDPHGVTRPRLSPAPPPADERGPQRIDPYLDPDATGADGADAEDRTYLDIPDE